MPAKGARCLTWDCPRKSRGRGGHGKRVARCGPGRDHREVRRGVREGVEEGQGTDAGAGSARWRAGAGRAPAGPSCVPDSGTGHRTVATAPITKTPRGTPPTPATLTTTAASKTITPDPHRRAGHPGARRTSSTIAARAPRAPPRTHQASAERAERPGTRRGGRRPHPTAPGGHSGPPRPPCGTRAPPERRGEERGRKVTTK